jgi:hypothetical protein
MRHNDIVRRWNPPPMLRSLAVTMAVALAWMVAIAATH